MCVGPVIAEPVLSCVPVMWEEVGAHLVMLSDIERGAPCSAGSCIPPHLQRALTSGTCGMKGAIETRVLLMPWKVASRN